MPPIARVHATHASFEGSLFRFSTPPTTRVVAPRPPVEESGTRKRNGRVHSVNSSFLLMSSGIHPMRGKPCRKYACTKAHASLSLRSHRSSTMWFPSVPTGHTSTRLFDRCSKSHDGSRDGNENLLFEGDDEKTSVATLGSPGQKKESQDLEPPCNGFAWRDGCKIRGIPWHNKKPNLAQQRSQDVRGRPTCRPKGLGVLARESQTDPVHGKDRTHTCFCVRRRSRLLASEVANE